MTSPLARADRLIRWLRMGTDVCSWDPKVIDAMRDRFAEEIADALDELREGFLRKPTHREGTR